MTLAVAPQIAALKTIGCEIGRTWHKIGKPKKEKQDQEEVFE
jgi:hypothetical protein